MLTALHYLSAQIVHCIAALPTVKGRVTLVYSNDSVVLYRSMEFGTHLSLAALACYVFPVFCVSKCYLIPSFITVITHKDKNKIRCKNWSTGEKIIDLLQRNHTKANQNNTKVSLLM